MKELMNIDFKSKKAYSDTYDCLCCEGQHCYACDIFPDLTNINYQIRNEIMKQPDGSKFKITLSIIRE